MLNLSSRSRGCGKCGKAEAFCAEAFPSSLWKSSRRNGRICRFPQLRHFPQPLAPADWFGSLSRRPIFAMGKIRRKFEVDFKRQLVAQIEAGELSMAQAARDYQLAHSVLERWRAQYRNNTLIDRPSDRERQLEAENQKLKKDAAPPRYQTSSRSLELHAICSTGDDLKRRSTHDLLPARRPQHELTGHIWVQHGLCRLPRRPFQI